MSIRLILTGDVPHLENEFQATFNFGFLPSYNIAMNGNTAGVCCDEPSVLQNLKWGFRHFSSAGNASLFFTAFSRELPSHQAYRIAVRTQRCLIPANAFILWIRHPGEKTPYVVYNKGQQWMSLAGIFERHTDPHSGITDTHFALITTAANRRLRPYSSFMPAIIRPSLRRKYLNTATHLKDIMQMLRPFESDVMNLFPISREIEDTGKDERRLVMPVGQRVYPEYVFREKALLKLEGMGSRAKGEHVIIDLKSADAGKTVKK
ncbi:MAG: SOS response-associated peptidase family protein [Cyclobacteriaceae bacterium]|nr:SOS response-associated peptidase family protein [Cyclobacteriaceae bacterium]